MVVSSKIAAKLLLLFALGYFQGYVAEFWLTCVLLSTNVTLSVNVRILPIRPIAKRQIQYLNLGTSV
ncbi:unnamed protein product [Penicillium nalgiovense]|nr:unnamed protein product [Penicillium nalgiovense]CAG8190362.1 unnamed protein product [Penicillium nalgiovense]